MGVRGELFSTRVLLQNRTYFFNVKENRLGDLYLNIVESKNRDEGGFERQSVILFAEDLQEFLQGFDESLRVLEKAEREKRRGKGFPAEGRGNDREKGNDRDRSRNSSERDYEKGESRRPSPAGRRSDRDYEKSDRRPRSPAPDRKSNRPDRTGSRPGRSAESPEPRRGSRYGNKDRERPGGNYRSEDKEFTPRKKKVVVRKK